MAESMKIYWSCICVFLLASSCSGEPADNTAQISESTINRNHLNAIPDSVAGYIDAALDSMQQYSIRRNYIDWAQLRTFTFRKAKGATTYQQTYPAIREALK